MPRRLRWALVAAAIAGCALRLAFAFGYWTHKPLTRDEREYLSLARGIASGRGLTYDEAVTNNGAPAPFSRAPGYPVVLALIGGGQAPTDAVPAGVKAAQSAIGAIAIWLVGAIAWRAGGARASMAAAWIVALYPPLIWISSYALSEVVILPIGLAAVWLFDRSTRDGRTQLGAAVLCGLVVGAGILVRPAMLFFLAVAIPWLVWRRRWTLALVLAVSTLLIVLPWTARNYARYHRVVLVASEGGVTFWTGNHPLARGEGDLAANPDLKRAQIAVRAHYANLTEEEMEPVYYRAAFAWIRAEPLQWMRLELMKAFYLVVPAGPSYAVHSGLYRWTSVASYSLLAPFAIVGAIRMGRGRASVPGLWLLLASTVVMSLAFFPQERFRIPIIDPVIIVCASMLAARIEGAGE